MMTLTTSDLLPGDVVVLPFTGVRCLVTDDPEVWVAESPWVRAEHAKGAPKFQTWATVLDTLDHLPARFDTFRKMVADDGGRWLLVDFDGGVSTWEVDRHDHIEWRIPDARGDGWSCEACGVELQHDGAPDGGFMVAI